VSNSQLLFARFTIVVFDDDNHDDNHDDDDDDGDDDGDDDDGGNYLVKGVIQSVCGVLLLLHVYDLFLFYLVLVYIYFSTMYVCMWL
jgi:hypothetical protein